MEEMSGAKRLHEALEVLRLWLGRLRAVDHGETELSREPVRKIRGARGVHDRGRDAIARLKFSEGQPNEAGIERGAVARRLEDRRGSEEPEVLIAPPQRNECGRVPAPGDVESDPDVSVVRNLLGRSRVVPLPLLNRSGIAARRHVAGEARPVLRSHTRK